jgi:hypothetical protein
MSSRALTAVRLPIMGKNSMRVLFEHVIYSKLVPRRVSAERRHHGPSAATMHENGLG